MILHIAHPDPPHLGELLLCSVQDEDGDTEEIWVEPTSDSNLYKVRCIPFFLKDINMDDIIQGIWEGKKLVFDKMMARSEWYSFRIRIIDSSIPFLNTLQFIDNLNGLFEEYLPDFYAVSVTGENVERVLTHLNELERNGWIEFDTLDSKERM